MRLRKLGWAAGLLLASAATQGQPASAADALSAAEREQVEQLVHDYIMKNPRVMLESLHAYDAQQQQAAQKDSQTAVAASLAKIERDPSSPVAGNPKGDVTVVEFFDYRCGYCRKVVSAVRELLKTDDNVRFVFKELPILGPDSVTASRLALAAWTIAPEKYMAFHQALMDSRGDLTEARVLEIATKTGIDAGKLKAASASPDVTAAIEKNNELAQSLRIQGTPAFIVGGKLVPGAVDVETLRELVKAARSG